ncbi:hypothetical protein [Kineothrix sedimenti]|uniref:Tail protein n=1 Tax=Kineothrix sedimenti TaxID=3123317 RepID=A0ABZ3EZT7_9FIRM
MFFIGNNILGADVNTLPLTPTSVKNMTYIVLQNGLFDCLYITKETQSEPTMDCPDEWNFDTIFHADFNNSTSAGNVNWNLNTVSHILIKRRDNVNNKWITIAVKKIDTLEDFTSGIITNDYFNASNTQYEYALLSTLYGTESEYYTTFADSTFDSIFFAEKNNIVGSPASDGFCDTARVFPSSNSVTILNKYPTYIRNTKANYDKGSFKGKFLYLDEETCEFEIEDGERIKFQRKVIDFLSDGMPKLLKHFDGRIWLIQITSDISDTADSTYNNRDVSFEWVEIGNYASEEHLYKSNLSDVTEEWWNL